MGLDRLSLPSPCLVLDSDSFKKNLTTMRDMALSAGKMLRPHAKTHKCSNISTQQIAIGGCAGICAAKLSEAETLLNAGIGNVLITSPVVTVPKIERMIDLAASQKELIVVVDAKSNVEDIDRIARQKGIRMDVLIDVDPDMGRTGVAFSDAVGFAAFVTLLPGLRLRGIQCYAGHLQHIAERKERYARSHALMGQAAAVFREIRTAPYIDIFTGTGTGTAEADLSISELTDIQVGSYCVMDAEYINIGGSGGGKFDTFKPAMTLLSTVISNNRADFITVDAGLKQLYFTPAAPPEIIGRSGNWHYEWFGDEHGKVFFPSNASKPDIGDIIELMLPHCDPTINLHDVIWVTKNGVATGLWQIDLRGMGQ